MKTFEEILQKLKEKFEGENNIEGHKEGTEDVIQVAPSLIKAVSDFLISEPGLNFDSMILLSGVDDENGEKTTEVDGSFTITGGTLSVYYHLESTTLKHKLVLRISVPRDEPTCPSVAMVWRTADWHEREAYDLLGIVFEGHPELKRILMPYDWEFGYPLRKDYKNPEFYNGMKVPY